MEFIEPIEGGWNGDRTANLRSVLSIYEKKITHLPISDSIPIELVQS